MSQDKTAQIGARRKGSFLPVFRCTLSLKRACVLEGVLKGAQKPPLTGVRRGPGPFSALLGFQHNHPRYVISLVGEGVLYSFIPTLSDSMAGKGLSPSGKKMTTFL